MNDGLKIILQCPNAKWWPRICMDPNVKQWLTQLWYTSYEKISGRSFTVVTRALK